ncbi:MAG TPA: ATP-dependent helicase [Thermoanaerobaculia bacterium]|nr:ATP-dependent helicase [Thermoanaerobaculia bacterium]
MAERRYVLKTPSAPKTYRVDYDGELNAEQKDVVFAGSGPVLVIAGAGSGKTRTLVYRVSRLIESGVDPSKILLLTFTNKAAREMMRRVEALLTIDARKMAGGTFHSLGNRLLRQYGERIGLSPHFTILDPEDAREILEASTSDLQIKTLDRRFPKGDVLLDLYSFTINTERKLSEVLAERAPHFLTLHEEIVRVFGRYLERKKAARACDYDDLLLHWKTLLDTETGGELSRRFSHVLVDEYQDTNRLQGEIVDGMARGHGNVTVVGDDAQSIYAFRGASFDNIIGFPERWPKAQVFRLTTNYRSVPEILALANASIDKNERQFRKELTAVRPAGQIPGVVPLPDAFDQARFVAQRILEWRDEGEKLSDCAVLYRSHYQAMELQMELTRRSIPYEIRSGIRFFEQRHVKDVLAFLRILVNPHDEISWKRALKIFPRIGERTAASIWDAIGQAREPLETFRRGDFSGAGRGAETALAPFRKLLGRLDAPSMRNAPAEAIREIVDSVYRDFARAKFANGDARLDDLEQFAQFAAGYASLPDFLDEVSLYNELSGEDTVAGLPEDERVVLSSIHQAKGLEWRRVAVIGLSEGRFPNYRASATAEGLEEERRLFYVACTRAKDELLLTYPMLARDRYSTDVILEASRFVSELPGEVYEKWIVELEPEERPERPSSFEPEDENQEVPEDVN